MVIREEVLDELLGSKEVKTQEICLVKMAY